MDSHEDFSKTKLKIIKPYEMILPGESNGGLSEMYRSGWRRHIQLTHTATAGFFIRFYYNQLDV